uniref:Uncharacterized protein n=1 Tax=Ciona intestinalis TaxID=7719 RepID=F6XEY2_CIOIN
MGERVFSTAVDTNSVQAPPRDGLQALSPISYTLIYSCVAVVLFLFVLFTLWVIAQCCDRNRPFVTRKRLVNSHHFLRRNQSMCEPLYGSTTCISTYVEDGIGSVVNASNSGKATVPVRYISNSAP